MSHTTYLFQLCRSLKPITAPHSFLQSSQLFVISSGLSTPSIWKFWFSSFIHLFFRLSSDLLPSDLQFSVSCYVTRSPYVLQSAHVFSFKYLYYVFYSRKIFNFIIWSYFVFFCSFIIIIILFLIWKCVWRIVYLVLSYAIYRKFSIKNNWILIFVCYYK